ncbi:CBL-interacting protein kinase 23 [Porphyridium purpureum]|uniref:non-specific serine/threonine protein kinase n=1 Tax=Porphyridium purpureum TaxID=35688 RepID=A0A5J4Z064_PORPP|nr:CBL-interacting protein kinase 23 [Porphyridium purpureum]|eukprot:POR6831..scf208_2
MGLKKVGKYLLLETIGHGSFGKVKHAVHEDTGEQFAVKVLHKKKIRLKNLSQQVRREISVMSSLTHPNIVKLYQVLASETSIFIVMELVTGGELFDEILRRKRLPEDEARVYFRQLINAVEHCHKSGVFHRDLKPENLLLDESGRVKITDFGLSTLRGADTVAELLYTQCGTPHYVAPEIICSADRGYSGAKMDIWSCGIILFVLLAGFHPFDDHDLKRLFEKIVRADVKYPEYFSDGVRKLLSSMLCADPLKRASISTIQRDEWFCKEAAADVEEPVAATGRVAFGNLESDAAENVTTGPVLLKRRRSRIDSLAGSCATMVTERITDEYEIEYETGETVMMRGYSSSSWNSAHTRENTGSGQGRIGDVADKTEAEDILHTSADPFVGLYASDTPSRIGAGESALNTSNPASGGGAVVHDKHVSGRLRFKDGAVANNEGMDQNHSTKEQHQKQKKMLRKAHSAASLGTHSSATHSSATFGNSGVLQHLESIDVSSSSGVVEGGVTPAAPTSAARSPAPDLRFDMETVKRALIAKWGIAEVPSSKKLPVFEDTSVDELSPNAVMADGISSSDDDGDGDGDEGMTERIKRQHVLQEVRTFRKNLPSVRTGAPDHTESLAKTSSVNGKCGLISAETKESFAMPPKSVKSAPNSTAAVFVKEYPMTVELGEPGCDDLLDLGRSRFDTVSSASALESKDRRLNENQLEEHNDQDLEVVSLAGGPIDALDGKQPRGSGGSGKLEKLNTWIVRNPRKPWRFSVHQHAAGDHARASAASGGLPLEHQRKIEMDGGGYTLADSGVGITRNAHATEATNFSNLFILSPGQPVAGLAGRTGSASASALAPAHSSREGSASKSSAYTAAGKDYSTWWVGTTALDPARRQSDVSGASVQLPSGRTTTETSLSSSVSPGTGSTGADAIAATKQQHALRTSEPVSSPLQTFLERSGSSSNMQNIGQRRPPPANRSTATEAKSAGGFMADDARRVLERERQAHMVDASPAVQAPDEALFPSVSSPQLFLNNYGGPTALSGLGYAAYAKSSPPKTAFRGVPSGALKAGPDGSVRDDFGRGLVHLSPAASFSSLNTHATSLAEAQAQVRSISGNSVFGLEEQHSSYSSSMQTPSSLSHSESSSRVSLAGSRARSNSTQSLTKFQKRDGRVSGPSGGGGFANFLRMVNPIHIRRYTEFKTTFSMDKTWLVLEFILRDLHCEFSIHKVSDSFWKVRTDAKWSGRVLPVRMELFPLEELIMVSMKLSRTERGNTTDQKEFLDFYNYVYSTFCRITDCGLLDSSRRTDTSETGQHDAQHPPTGGRHETGGPSAGVVHAAWM